jgi:predicted transcriptional regulator
MAKSSVLQVRVEPDLKETLWRLARDHRRPLSEEVRISLEQRVAAYSKSAAPKPS